LKGARWVRREAAPFAPGPPDQAKARRLVVERARTVPLAADGSTRAQIAERAGSTEPTVIKWCRPYAEAGWPGWKTRRARGSPKTVLTEEVSDKPSDYGSRLQQTQRDVTRHRNSSDLR
jgi:transposase